MPIVFQDVYGLCLAIQLAAPLHKLHRLLFHTFAERSLFVYTLRGGEVAHVLRDFHRAEAWAAHRAEVRDFGGLFGQGFVVEFARLVRVEAEVELVFPAELEARLGQRVVANLRAGVPFGEVGGVRGNLVGDDAFLHVVLVRQAQIHGPIEAQNFTGEIPPMRVTANMAGGLASCILRISLG